jgi:hypothetical protein
MEIQALKLFITDADLAALVARYLAEAETIEELQVRLTPEGVVLSGKYPAAFFKVPFETVWQVIAAGPDVHVKLDAVRVAGLPANLLRGALMKTVRDKLEGQPGMRVDEDSVIIHVTDAARAHGVDVRVHFTTVRMSIGAAVVEASSQP